MQRSTDGTPAALLRRAPAWQYWQAIWYEPAWMTWLKKIGCSGACRVCDRQHLRWIVRGLGQRSDIGDDLANLHVRQEGREFGISGERRPTGPRAR